MWALKRPPNPDSSNTGTDKNGRANQKPPGHKNGQGRRITDASAYGRPVDCQAQSSKLHQLFIFAGCVASRYAACRVACRATDAVWNGGCCKMMRLVGEGVQRPCRGDVDPLDPLDPLGENRASVFTKPALYTWFGTTNGKSVVFPQERQRLSRTKVGGLGGLGGLAPVVGSEDFTHPTGFIPRVRGR